MRLALGWQARALVRIWRSNAPTRCSRSWAVARRRLPEAERAIGAARWRRRSPGEKIDRSAAAVSALARGVVKSSSSFLPATRRMWTGATMSRLNDGRRVRL